MTRPRTPVELHSIQGTKPDYDPKAEQLPQYSPLRDFPAPPQHLNPDGAELWNSLGTELVACGVVQVVDVSALEQLCYAWQVFRQKAKAGMDVSASEHNSLRQLFSDFGLTPAARRRVAASITDPPKKQENKFAKFKS